MDEPANVSPPANPPGDDHPVSREQPSGPRGPASGASGGKLGSETLRLRPTTIIAISAILAILFFAREVFIPLSLSILLSFLLSIPCSFLERHSVPHVPAVILVVLLALSLLAGIGWLLSSQLFDLAGKLPGYQDVIETKLQALKTSPHSTLGQFNKMLRQTAEELRAPETNDIALAKSTPAPTLSRTNSANLSQEPIPVEIREPQITSWGVLGGMVGPMLRPAANAFLVLVVLFFMLLGREDLRNRVIRLAGTDRIDLTTDALDEASDRVSRYLLMQLAVNTCFGILIGFGLSLIGVPNASLWGCLAMLLRFVPYVGAWIAAVAPLALAFAMHPGWSKLVWTVGLYASVELVTSNFIEPLLYGSSTGVSPLALLMAAIFWTWLWGPIGLLLSTPLTVCLAVLGLHVPRLHVLHVLLGDEPVLTPETRFYQRMLAQDASEAAKIADELLKEKPVEGVYEELMVPALKFAKEDLSRGRLTRKKESFILDSIADLSGDLAEENAESKVNDHPPAPDAEVRKNVIIMPAKDRPDEIAGLLLQRLLSRRGAQSICLTAAALPTAHFDEIEKEGVKIVCISVVPPSTLRRTRYLCKKLRARFPEVKLVLCLWGGPDRLPAARQTLSECGIDSFVGTYAEALNVIHALRAVQQKL
jgi:predicted PurR-regulated permease PerM